MIVEVLIGITIFFHCELVTWAQEVLQTITTLWC